jgi:hypothetical protein
MIETSASHFIETDEVRRWLAEHDVDIRQISDATIRIGRHYDVAQGCHAWLELTWYATDRMGCRYVTGNREGAAQEHTKIPLRSWPALTEV